jgi:hypothetical protein
MLGMTYGYKFKIYTSRQAQKLRLSFFISCGAVALN